MRDESASAIGRCDHCDDDEVTVRDFYDVKLCRSCHGVMMDQIHEWEDLLDKGEHALVVSEDRYLRRVDGEWEQDYHIGEGSRSRTTTIDANAYGQIAHEYLHGDVQLVDIEQHPMTENPPNPFL